MGNAITRAENLDQRRGVRMYEWTGVINVRMGLLQKQV